jgi:hypothetical protein
MTEFALYIDDGGHPDDQPFVVVAGYVATGSAWHEFESRWRDALTKSNVGNVFHMTEFMNDRYKYSILRREQILSTLALITKTCTLYPFVCAIDIAAYKRVNEEFAFEECHGAPYAVTARSLARILNIWKDKNLQVDDRLQTFVEEGTKHYGDLEQLFKRDGLPLPKRVPKATPQVQPADILAWELFNWLRHGSPKQQSNNLKRLTVPIRKKEDMGGILHEADLRRICADTDVYRRSTLNPGDTIAFHSDRKRKRKRTIK